MDEPGKIAGRPPLDEAKFDAVQKLLKAGSTPTDIHKATGVSLTKIYEIRRWLKAAS